MKYFSVISICFQEGKQKQSLMPFVIAVQLALFSAHPGVLFLQTRQNKRYLQHLLPANIYSSHSSRSSPPAQPHKIEWEMKNPPSNTSTPKGIHWIENKEGMQKKPSFSNYWWSRILEGIEQWEDLKAAPSYTHHLWATSILLMASKQLEHSLC